LSQSRTNYWLNKAKKRTSFLYRLTPDSGSADRKALELKAPDIAATRIVRLYDAKDVFNMDETGLFYCNSPKTTIAQKRQEGLKVDKRRITIALTCNSDGSEKLDPLIIGTSKQPRCFQKRTAEQLGFTQYYNNSKAWMTGSIFQAFLRSLNSKFASQNRKILLLVDNASSHVLPDDLKASLPHVEVLFIPPNVTSIAQPMDLGVIANFKQLYRRMQLERAVATANSSDTDYSKLFAVDVLTAMRWTKLAWNDVCHETLKKCFGKSLFFQLAGLEENASAARNIDLEPFGNGLVRTSSASIEQDTNLVRDIEKCLKQLKQLHIVEDSVTADDACFPLLEDKVHATIDPEDFDQVAITSSHQEVDHEDVLPTLPLAKKLEYLNGFSRIVEEADISSQDAKFSWPCAASS